MINFSGKLNFKKSTPPNHNLNSSANSSCSCGQCSKCKPQVAIVAKRPLMSDTVSFRGPLSQER